MIALARIDALIAARQFASAREALQSALADADAGPQVHGRLIDVCLAMGDAPAALEAAHAFERHFPREPDACFYRAKCEWACGRLNESKHSLARLAAQGADRFAAFHLLAARVHLSAGDSGAATASLHRALERDPKDAEAWMMLAQVHVSAGDRSAAIEALTQGAQLSRSADAWVELGRLQAATGDVGPAAQAYRTALGMDAGHAGALRSLASLAAETFDFNTAKQCLVRFLSSAPGDEGALGLLGAVNAELGEDDAALAVLRTRTAAPPSTSRRAKAALYLPQVVQSREQIDALRAGWLHGLEELDGDPSWISTEAELFSLAHSNFLLAYHGLDDLPLQARYGRLVRERAARVAPAWLEPPAARPGDRIRVGFLSSFFRQCTVGHYFEHWIRDLDPRLFEVHVLSTGWQADALGRRLQDAAHRFEVLRGGAREIARRVRDAHFDILVYPEVGMGALNGLLAHLRLAPVQCAAWGHPVTTGSSSIDAFFSCEAMEPDDAAAHYLERIIGLPGIGTRYARPAPVAAFDRAAIRLDANAHVYACPQSLFKIHPDNDDLFLDIAAADPSAVILFFQALAPAVSSAFSGRLARKAEARGLDPRRHFRFVPRQTDTGFRAVLAMCDVVLDTLHWSGGNTSLDALAATTPIVTLPGRFMRGRQTRAMLGQAGVPELIATDRADYVTLATGIASDADRRAALRSRLAEGARAVFDQQAPITALGEALQALAGR